MVPKIMIFPTECRGYRLGRQLRRWCVNGAPRQDLLKEIKTLGVKRLFVS